MIYCELSDSETFVEIYNLTTDPHQLKNIRVSVNPQVCLLLFLDLPDLNLKCCSSISHLE